MSTSKRKCRMMGDIDAARKKEGKKKPKQLCMRLSPSKTFHTKICLQNDEEEEEEEERKKKEGANTTQLYHLQLVYNWTRNSK
jgi:hypothetical protein